MELGNHRLTVQQISSRKGAEDPVFQPFKEAVAYLEQHPRDITSATSRKHQNAIREFSFDVVSHHLDETCSLSFVITLLRQCQVPRVSTAQGILADVLWLFGTVYKPTPSSLVANQEGNGAGENETHTKKWTKCCELTKAIFQEKIVEEHWLREKLQLVHLEKAELDDYRNMRNKLIKANTKLLYTQQKYNLFREDAEGYARLMVTLLGCDMSNCNASNIVKRIQSLVGYFRLDPNRVFDLVLEAMEHNISKSLSSPVEHTPADIALGLEKEARMPTLDLSRLNNYAEIFREFSVNNLKHILGFKFAGYHQQHVVKTGTPYSLCCVVAELIALDLLQVPDIWTYLSAPEESEGNNLTKILDDQIKSFRVATLTKSSTTTTVTDGPQDPGTSHTGTLNGHAIAYVVAERTVSPESTFTCVPREIPMCKHQKVGLIESLLGLMCSTARTLREQGVRFPYSSVKDHQNQETIATCIIIFQRCWRSVVECCARSASEGEVHPALYPPVAVALCRLVDMLVEPLYVALLEANYSKKDVSEHYGEVESLVCAIFPLLRLCGPCLSNNLTCLDRICYINRYLWQNRKTESCSESVNSSDNQLFGPLGIDPHGSLAASYYILCYCVIPSLPLCGSNVNLSEKIWQVLELQPWFLRYSVYDHFQKSFTGAEASVDEQSFSDYGFTSSNSNPVTVWGWPDLPVEDGESWWSRCNYGDGLYKLVNIANGRADKLMRSKMKRLATTNVKECARYFGKLSHGNPFRTYSTVLDQVEKFDNLIGLFVEAMKFLTSLSLDVIAFLIIQKLASGRPAGDAYPEKWLSAITRFAVDFFKRFPQCGFHALVNMFMYRLINRDTHPMFVFQEIFEKAGGIKTSIDVSDKEVEGQAGSNALREITTMTSVSSSPADETIKSLVESFITGDKATERALHTNKRFRTLLPFFLLLVGIRNECVFGDEANENVKVLGSKFDNFQTVLMQFCELLARYAPIRQLRCLLDPIDCLIQKCHVQPGLSFALARPVIRAAMFEEVPGRPWDGLFSEEEVDRLCDGNEPGVSWDAFSDEFCNRVKNAIAGRKIRVARSFCDVWDCLTPKLFSIFWSLSLFDVLVPTPRYNEAAQRVKTEIESKEQERPESRKEREKRDGEIKYLKEMQGKLEEDLPKHREHTKRVRSKLEEVKHELISHEQRSMVVDGFVQMCVFPRAMLSPMDALYASTFLILLHDISTPSYCSLRAFDRAFEYLAPTIASSTEREAVNLGIFFRDILLRLNYWKQNSRAFEEQAASKIGFARRLDCTNDENAEKVPHDGFSKIHKAWHKKLTNVFVASLQTDEYIDIKNTLHILDRISKARAFPVYSCSSLLQAVKTVEENEIRKPDSDPSKRKDLIAPAVAYRSTLQKRVNELELPSEAESTTAALSSSAEKAAHAPVQPASSSVTVTTNSASNEQADSHNDNATSTSLDNPAKRRRVEQTSSAVSSARERMSGTRSERNNAEEFNSTRNKDREEAKPTDDRRRSEDNRKAEERSRRPSRSKDRPSHQRHSKDRGGNRERDTSESRRSSSRRPRSRDGGSSQRSESRNSGGGRRGYSNRARK